MEFVVHPGKKVENGDFASQNPKKFHKKFSKSKSENIFFYFFFILLLLLSLVVVMRVCLISTNTNILLLA